ncbi:MAG: cysteine desulfurase [Myxococcales bacterium]|nr:cysteine desulfurase [Myxococcales bacterium]
MRRIYLDHNASSPWRPAVAQWMRSEQAANLGNPSSFHAEGRAARQLIERARTEIAAALGADHPEQVLFVSGGTEANNLAIHAATQGSVGRAVGTAIEHPAVGRPLAALADSGWQVATLPVDGVGQVADWSAAVDARLLCVMRANNEVGTILDVAAARHAAPNAWLHCDAIQAIGKFPVDFKALGVDSLAVAGHKIGAPVGIGALLVRDRNRVQPVQRGGGQEFGLRSGTQAAALIEALRLAVVEGTTNLMKRSLHIEHLRDELEATIQAGLADNPPTIIGDQQARLANTSCMAFTGLSAEALVMELDARGVAVATGSACSSGSGRPSAVLVAMEAPVHGVLRLSLGPDHQPDELATAAAQVVAAVRRLRQIAAPV